MSTFTFKAKVLSFDEKRRTYDVNYYTDALLSDFESNEMPRRIEEAMRSDASLDTPEKAEAWCRTQYFPGERRSVTIYDEVPPIGAALLEYLMRCVPREQLEHRERFLRPARLDESVVGTELESSVEITPAPDMPIMMRVIKGGE